MVRFVVSIKLKPGAREVLDLPTIWDGLAKIDTPGVLAFNAGFNREDAHFGERSLPGGLQQIAWSFAVVIDFTDLGAFEAWFDHPDHYRISGHVEEYVEDTSRVIYDFPREGAAV
jgi:Stress responsive A/B Barrel Domain